MIFARACLTIAAAGAFACGGEPLEINVDLTSGTSDLSPSGALDLSRRFDFAQADLVAVSDLAHVADLATAYDMAQPHDMTSAPDLAMCGIGGNWSVLQTESHEGGCNFAQNCGYAPYAACGIDSLATASLPSATTIGWDYALFDPFGGFAGTITAARHFSTTTTSSAFGASTFIGDIDSSCHLTGVITLSYGACMATIKVTGTHR